MKISYLFFVVILAKASSGQLPKETYKKINGTTVYNVESKKVFLFTSGFMIDADGSPKAYHKDSKQALDYLGNAGKPGNWWALVTDTKKSSGNPVIQSTNDPAPGYYISMTSLQDGKKSYTDPTRYVNSETVPYIAIPPKFSKDFVLGDIALVINKKTNKKSFAIFADTGPANKIGEGSIYLAEQLGIKGNPKAGGAASDIVFILIKNSGKKMVLTKEEIEEIGKSKLTDSDVAELLK